MLLLIWAGKCYVFVRRSANLNLTQHDQNDLPRILLNHAVKMTDFFFTKYSEEKTIPAFYTFAFTKGSILFHLACQLTMDNHVWKPHPKPNQTEMSNFDFLILFSAECNPFN